MKLRRLSTRAAGFDVELLSGPSSDIPQLITPARERPAELQAQANRIARVLVEDLGLIPGNRVLLRGANSPMLAACWLAVAATLCFFGYLA